MFSLPDSMPLVNNSGYDSSAHPNSVVADGFGSIFVAGWTEGSLGGPSARGDDAFLMRFPFDPSCYPDCDANTLLNVDDFTCFINAFAQAQSLTTQQQIEHYANCDNSTTPPILTVDDFTCFINAFAAGCP